MKKPCNLGNDNGSLIAEESRPKIPEGEYEAICTKTEIGKKWQRDLYHTFKIHGGKYDGLELFMKCPFPKGRAKRNSKYYQQWCLANNCLPAKGQRLSRKIFPNRLYLVKVRDTRRRYNNSKELLPPFLQYSVVDTIIKPLT